MLALPAVGVRRMAGVLLCLLPAACASAGTTRRAVTARAAAPGRLSARRLVPPRPARPEPVNPAAAPADGDLPSGARAPGRPSVEKAALEFSDVKSPAHAVTVARALQQVSGVKSAIVDSRTGLGVVDYDPSRTALSGLLAACEAAGFPAEEYHVEKRFPKPIKLKGG